MIGKSLNLFNPFGYGLSIGVLCIQSAHGVLERLVDIRIAIFLALSTWVKTSVRRIRLAGDVTRSVLVVAFVQHTSCKCPKMTYGCFKLSPLPLCPGCAMITPVHPYMKVSDQASVTLRLGSTLQPLAPSPPIFWEPLTLPHSLARVLPPVAVPVFIHSENGSNKKKATKK